MDNILWIVVAVAILVLVIGRRLAGEPLRANRVTVLPLALAVIGLYQLTKLPHITPLDLTALGVEGIVAVVLGLVRGSTIRVYVRDGHLWQKYSWATIGMWAASILIRFGLTAGGVLLGGDRDVMQTGVLLNLGLTLAGEGLVIALRGRALGAPFAPGDRDQGGSAPQAQVGRAVTRARISS